MISVKKDFEISPALLVASDRNNLILDSINTKNKHAFASKVYRDTTLQELELLYHSKCAYCETDTAAGAPMQVEHYRPKAKVTEDSSHLGYYWLAYEWSNLILSCSKCNNKKRNRFPILNTRLTEPQLDIDGLPTDEYRLANSLILNSEGTFLLHPEIDIVEDHFLYNEKAEIVGRTPQALETIKICGLNRKELVFKRLSILNEFRDDIKTILTDVLEQKVTTEQCRYAIKLVFQKLAGLQSPVKQYSRFGYFLFYKFDLFIANSLEPKQKNAVKLLFEQFLKGTL
jgi:5-methylcytosine-specific restriction endonuclease McrA